MRAEVLWISRPRLHRLPALSEARRARRSDTEAVRAAGDWTRAQLLRLTAETLRVVARAYIDGGRELAQELQAIIQRYGGQETWPIDATGIDAAQRAQRLRDLLRQADTAIQAILARAGQAILDGAERAYRQGYWAAAWNLDLRLPQGASVLAPLLPHQAVRAAALFPYGGLTWFERMGEQRQQFIARMRRAVVVSQIEGDSIQDATDRFMRELGIVPGEGPLADRQAALAQALRIPQRTKGLTPRKHAEMIARTELIRSSALGNLALYGQNADVLDGVEWQATNDAHTEAICASRDGKVWALDDPNRPEIPAHPRCRCTWLPVVKSFADLGLPGLVSLEPKPRRTYAQWAAQRGIAPAEDGGLRRAE